MMLHLSPVGMVRDSRQDERDVLADMFSQYLTLSAFNLVPGTSIAVTDHTPTALQIMGAPLFVIREVVVSKVTRDADSETVLIVARFVDHEDDHLEPHRNYGDLVAIHMDYCDDIDVVGLCVNPGDRDDNNVGR